MATIKELVTRFGFDIDDKGLKQLEGGISAARDGILGLGVIMGGAAVSLFGVIKSAANAGNELLIMSQQAGVGVEALQKLQFQASLADISAQDLSQSMNFLNRNMNNARQGSAEAVQAFRDAGVSVQQLRDGSFTTDKALGVLAKKFQTMPDGPRKTGLAMDLFGRSGARMIVLLNELNKGLTPVQEKILQMSMITEEQARAGDEFGDSLTVLQTGIKTIIKTVGFELMPVAQELVNQITLWIVENKELIKSNIVGFARGLTAVLRITVRFVDLLVKSLSGLAHSFGGVETATKLLLVSLALLSGSSLLIGIGKLIQAVVTLGNSFAVANMKLAAIPLLIGAAVVALLLVMEDIYSFFNGKDSFLGDLLSFLPELGETFRTTLEPIFEPFVALVTMIGDGFGSWVDILMKLGEVLVNTILAPIRLIISSIASLSSVAGRMFGSDTLSGFAKTAGNFANGLTFAGAEDQLSGITPQMALAGGPSKSVRNDVQVSQQFNFPPGTDPIAVSEKISSQATDGFDEVLRSTQRSSTNGGQY